MSNALIVTCLAFLPVLLLCLAFFRSIFLTKYLDDPHTKRPPK